MGLLDNLYHLFRKVFDTTKNYGSALYSGDSISINRTWSSKIFLSTVVNRIAVDVSSLTFRNIRVVKGTESYLETIDSPLNECLTRRANIDQTGRELIQDICESLIEEGVIALVPMVTSSDSLDDRPDIYELRVGKIIRFYPGHVEVEVYNDISGKKERVTLSKDYVCVITNPLTALMAKNPVLEKLVNRMDTLDVLNSRIGSNRLDLILQLPYAIKTETKKQKADERIEELEEQLNRSKYGIAYFDAVEKIIPLNRPIVSNTLDEVKYLTELFYAQLGISQSVFNGTSDDQEYTNYFRSCIGPVCSAISEAIEKTYVSKTAYTKGSRIRAHQSAFKNVPLSKLTDVITALSTNAVMSSNEIRGELGLPPDKDETSNKLNNKNTTAYDGTSKTDTKEEPKNEEK